MPRASWKYDRQNQISPGSFKIDQIIVPKSGDGAMVNDYGTIYEHPGYKVSVQDTIGNGDSFLAGYPAQLLKSNGADEALDFVAGIGAFVATGAGGCPEYDVEEIDELMEGQKKDTEGYSRRKIYS